MVAFLHGRGDPNSKLSMALYHGVEPCVCMVGGREEERGVFVLLCWEGPNDGGPFCSVPPTEHSTSLFHSDFHRCQ